MRFPACIKHNGRHMDVHGQCVHGGAPVALRPGVCLDCGAETMRRYDLTDGSVTTVEAGSDAVHWHPQPVRVTLDEDALAGAILRASRAARQERAPANDSAVYVPRTPERNGHAKPALGGIPDLGIDG